VDLHFFDHEGNLVDCACIAAVTALLHFRRPDVSVIGEEVTIVSLFDVLAFFHLRLSQY
jgi:exosome complex component RRP45